MSGRPKRPTFLEMLDRLTRETPSVLHSDDGPKLAKSDGLLQQLRAAMFAGMEGTGGSSAFGSKPPIDAGAADLLDEISTEAAQALAAATHMPTPLDHVEGYVRLWAAQVGEKTIVEIRSKATLAEEKQAKGKPNVYLERAEYTAYDLLLRWVEKIDDFFNPPSSREIPAPCPACGERYVHRIKDGETIRSAALNIHRDRNSGAPTEARCSVCASRWAPAQFVFLAKLVGADTAPDLELLALPEHTMEIVNGHATFYCTAAATAPCHFWPDCECETWPEDHEKRHPSIGHAECFYDAWYNTQASAKDLWGHPDELPMPEQHPRAGFEVEWDECPLWWFADTVEAAAEPT